MTGKTCVFAIDGAPPSARERDAYLAAVAALVAEKVPLAGVRLYGLARPSFQPEAPRLSRLPAEWIESFGREIEARGLRVQVSP